MRAEVAIVGNGVAGFACAARLARVHGARPLLIGPGLPADRPPLTKQALAAGEVRLLADGTRLAERGIEHADTVVVEADLGARALRLESGEIVDADAIVLATGLRYDPPAGLSARVNATPQGLTALAPELRRPRRIRVVGAGLIGVETAATLAAGGHVVSLVDLLDRPLDRLHDPIPELAAAELERLGVRFTGGGADPSDDPELVIAATGAHPVVPPGLDATVPLVVGDDLLVAGLERVHACGDLIHVPHARFGPIRFPQWDAAIGTGEHAADAVAGDVHPYERLPYWWSDIGELRLAEVGWSGAVTTWADEDGVLVGRDGDGVAVCAMVVDDPRRLREARLLVDGS